MDTEYKMSSSKLENIPIIDAQCCVNLTPARTAVPVDSIRRKNLNVCGHWSFVKRCNLMFWVQLLFAVSVLSFSASVIYWSVTSDYFHLAKQSNKIDHQGSSITNESHSENPGKEFNDRNWYQLWFNDPQLGLSPEMRSVFIQLSKSRSKREAGAVPCSQSAEHCKTVINSMMSIVSIVNSSMHHLQSLVKDFSGDQNSSKSKFMELIECLQCKNDSIAFNDQSGAGKAVNDYPIVYEHSDHAQIQNNVNVVTNLLSDDQQKANSSVNVNDQVNFKVQDNEDGLQDSKVPIFDDHEDTRGTTKQPETTEHQSGFTEAERVNASTDASTIKPEETKGIDTDEITLKISTIKPDGDNVTEIVNGTVHPSVHPSVQGHAEQNVPEVTNDTTSPKNSNLNNNLKSRVMINDRFQRVGKADLTQNMIPTAETIKSTQQLQLTPTMSWMPYQVCFYGPQANGAGKQAGPGPVMFPISSPGANYPVSMSRQRPGFQSSGNQAPNYVQVQAQSVQFFPMQPYPEQKTGPTGPGTNLPVFPGHQSSPSGGASGSGKPPYYCTYIPAPTFQFPAIPGVSEYQRSADSEKEAETKDVAKNEESDGQGSYSGPSGVCPSKTIRCGDGKGCILRTQWCDGQVDCSDASDETTCSCRDRISQERLCDGYFDCPHGEDELGCLGCSKTYFSCNDWHRRYSSDNCVPFSQRCDGIRQCLNGKDEMDCNMLMPTYMEGKNVFTIGYTEGYLHKNYKGQWYPVCTAADSWARDACASEIGSQAIGEPEIKIQTIPDNVYYGSYLADVDGQMKLIPSCMNTAVYVKCPRLPCGTRMLSRQDRLRPFVLENEGQNALRGLKKHDSKSTSMENEIVGSELRVVGGRASEPKAWPFLVAIYRDGNFYCGGIILDELWVLTAAHCLDGYKSHYYEIQAGMLRRFSFSPMSQTRKARYTIMHPQYSGQDMKNDIGMIMLDEPLRFNRWVRPVCLPGPDTLGPLWRLKPETNSTCIAIGWGATREHGPDPDHLREVEVPILEKCKQEVDRNEASICAGYPQGGRDACQGDSGGPLMCRHPYSESQWYVAGIVSHGEGCGRPNEPGAYAKVSYFQEWIKEVSSGQGAPPLKRTPLEKCPGFSCEGGLGKCLPIEARCNRIVDCLDGEDEINCLGHLIYPEYRQMDDSKLDSEPVKPRANNNSSLSEKLINNATIVPITTNYSLSSNDQINEIDSNDADEMNMTTQEFIETSTDSLTTVTVSVKIFTCRRLLQSISIDKRCDRVVDCEDGTDEVNCTCKDFLSTSKPNAICDGFVDCDDKTDEEDCEFCGSDEFFCRGSKSCIPSSKKCDGTFDCEFKEDELDCFTLTNGRYVYLDADGRPFLNMHGVLTRYVKGKWQPTCHRARIHQNQSTAMLIGQNMCEYFGFANLQSSEEVSIRDSELETIDFNKENQSLDEDSSALSPNDDDKTCSGLYIRCRPVLSGTVNTQLAVDPTTGSRVYLWPWLAAIFVDGSYRCSAILLDREWLLSASKCVENVRLDQNYTTAVLGYGPLYRYVDGPHQQISIVDEVQPVNNSLSVLLHLKNGMNVARHVRPLFLEKTIYLPGINDTCVAVGTDKNYETKSIFLRPILQNCQTCQRCFVNTSISECSNNQSDWTGTIFCHGKKGWYPAASFQDKNGPCSFKNLQTLTSIDHINPYLMEAIESTRLSLGAKCDGFRCTLGQCISHKRVCDGVPDCRDHADEDPKYCEQIQETCENSVDGCNCKKSELRCRNGRCVDKSAFCDGNMDCSDESDEPPVCTCAEYLKLTAPQKLCDGVRHCLDKTDESPEMCPCGENSFRCRTLSGNNTCIPQDFICDGDKDCIDGEDEGICRMLKQSPNDSSGTGELIQRNYGVWHTECLSNPVTSKEEVSNLCRTMGYLSGDVYNTTQVIDEAIDPKRDEFYMVKINTWTWMTLRDDKPLITLMKPEKTCYRAFISCV